MGKKFEMSKHNVLDIYDELTINWSEIKNDKYKSTKNYNDR